MSKNDATMLIVFISIAFFFQNYFFENDLTY